MNDWLDILRQAVADRGGNISAVSRAMCGGKRLRPRLSLALNGEPFGKPANLEKLVRDCFERYACPYLGREISKAECTKYTGKTVPTSSPHAVRHWRACQTCAHKEKS